MGLLDRFNDTKYEAIPFLGDWFVRRCDNGIHSYMTELYTCDDSPMWVPDMKYATKYSYDTAHKIVNDLERSMSHEPHA